MTKKKKKEEILLDIIRERNIPEIIETLQQTEKLHLTDKSTNPILSAISYKLPESIVRLLAEKGLSILNIHSSWSSPLCSLIKEKYSLNIIEFFIQNGANVKWKDYQGNTICHYAAEREDCLDLFQIILKYGSKKLFSAVNKWNESLLQRYLKYQREKTVIDFLLNLGLSFDQKFLNNTSNLPENKKHKTTYQQTEKDNGWTALFYLLMDSPDRDDLVRYAIEEHRADVSSKTNYGYTILMQAVRYNCSLSLIQYLIEKGCDPLASTKYGKTCLTIACQYSNSVDVVSFFFQLNPDIQIHTNQNVTPLMYACMNLNANLEIVQFLVGKGFAIDSQTEVDETRDHPPQNLYEFTEVYIPESWTALMFANRNPKGLEIVKYLISIGANINIVSSAGDSLLHLMCLCNFDRDKLIYYLEHGADTNLVNKKGDTCLNLYMGNNDVELEVLKILDNHGLNFSHKELYKRNYLYDYSKYRKLRPERYNKEIAEFLLSKLYPEQYIRMMKLLSRFSKTRE